MEELETETTEGDEQPVGLDLNPPNIGIEEAAAVMSTYYAGWESQLQQYINYCDQSTSFLEAMEEFDLTRDEAIAIYLYTTASNSNNRDNNLYIQLNKLLSSRNVNSAWLPYVYYLVKGLEKLPSHELVLYRAINVPITQLSRRYKPNKIIIWLAVTSCTSNERVLHAFESNDGGGTRMKIHAKKAKFIKRFSNKPREDEYILLPNTTFKVREVFNSSFIRTNNLDLLSMEEIDLTAPPPTTTITMAPSGGPIVENPKVGGIIEIYDNLTQKWLTSRIVNVYPSQSEIKIHFEGWEPRWDEKISIFNDAKRIRPANFQELSFGTDFPVDQTSWDRSITFTTNSNQIQWGTPITDVILEWDIRFGADYYMFSPNRKICCFVKESPQPGISDSSKYPAVRISTPFTSLFSIKFKISGYCWFGVGTAETLSSGFPGYTENGWLFCSHGKYCHNQNPVGFNFVIPPNQDCWFSCDPVSSKMALSCGNFKFLWPVTPPLPREVYFIASMAIGSCYLL